MKMPRLVCVLSFVPALHKSGDPCPWKVELVTHDATLADLAFSDLQIKEGKQSIQVFEWYLHSGINWAFGKFRNRLGQYELEHTAPRDNPHLTTLLIQRFSIHLAAWCAEVGEEQGFLQKGKAQ